MRQQKASADVQYSLLKSNQSRENMTQTQLTKSQRNILLAVKNGSRRYNGRSTKPINTLDELGLVTVDYEIRGLAHSHQSDSYTVTITPRGELLADELAHQAFIRSAKDDPWEAL